MQDTLKHLKDSNAAFAILSSVILDSGRIFTTSERISEILQPVAALSAHERISSLDLTVLARATARDVVILENPSVDELWSLAGLSAAQVIAVSERQTDTSFVEACLPLAEFRSGILSLAQHGAQIERARRQAIFFDGDQSPALFLDRDGVVIEHVDYIKDPSQVRLVPGIVELIREAHGRFWKVIVVTNQSGLGRGFYGWSEYRAVNQKMCDLLAEKQSYLDFIYEAPYFSGSQEFFGLVRRSLRKPRSGMLVQASENHGVNLRRSALIGDRATDIMAAAQAGLGQAYLLKSSVLDEEVKTWNNWPLRSRSVWGGGLKVLESLTEFNFQQEGL